MFESIFFPFFPFGGICYRSLEGSSKFVQTTLDGGFKDFSIFTSYLGKMSNLTSIFFKGVGSTTNQIINYNDILRYFDPLSDKTLLGDIILTSLIWLIFFRWVEHVETTNQNSVWWRLYRSILRAGNWESNHSLCVSLGGQRGLDFR